MSDPVIPITRLSSEIRQLAGRDGPGYRKLHLLACDGKLPGAHQVGNGRRWGVFRRDLPAILEALGLQPIGSAQ